MHLCTVKTVIWQLCSNRPGKKVPQSARLSVGEGVQSLFGQCPNRGAANRNGASLIYIFTNESYIRYFVNLLKATWSPIIRGSEQ